MEKPDGLDLNPTAAWVHEWASIVVGVHAPIHIVHGSHGLNMGMFLIVRIVPIQDQFKFFPKK